jgi:hypothetical protein
MYDVLILIIGIPAGLWFMWLICGIIAATESDMTDKQRRGEQFTAHLNVHNIDTDTLAIGLEPGELLILSTTAAH